MYGNYQGSAFVPITSLSSGYKWIAN